VPQEVQKVNENFQEIYEKYHKEIYFFLLKLTGYRKDLAEELTQETLYQTFLSLHKYRGECGIKTWIFQIAKNTCFKYYRKNPIHISMDEEEFQEVQIPESCKSVEEYLVDKEFSRLLLQCIRKLKPKYQDVLIYRLYLELHFAQIGKMLKISENSAKVIYHRGREMLKKEMEVLHFGRNG
jgi:RNA polymerase sigma-70 factor (ECF subfamily)